jgi:hypothetical protein
MHSRLMAWCGSFLVGGALVCVLGSSACGSSSSGTGPLSDDTAADDSGASSSGSSSGASSGASSSGGTVRDAGSSSGIADDGSAEKPTVIACGTTCSLKTQTCCLDLNMNGHCVAHGTSCGTSGGPPEAAFNCEGASDCPSGQVCCGVADQTMLQAETVCMAKCPTESSSSTQGQVQVCKGDKECQNGKPCIPQTCHSGSNLNLCGLTPQAPFSCSAR